MVNHEENVEYVDKRGRDTDTKDLESKNKAKHSVSILKEFKVEKSFRKNKKNKNKNKIETVSNKQWA